MIALSLIGSLLLAFPAQAAPQVWIGVALSGEGEERAPGVGIVEVFEGSPAQAAGLRAGDRLMSIDERPLGSYEELVRRLSQERPSNRLSVWVRRDVPVRLDPARAEEGRPLLGVMLADGEYEGMLTITDVLEGSPAERAGLRAGDQLRSIDGHGTPTVALLKRGLAGRDPAGSALAGISRRLTVELGATPRENRQRRTQRSERAGGAEGRSRLERRMREIEAARERGRHGVRTERQPAPHRDLGEVHEHSGLYGGRKPQGRGEWRAEAHDLGRERGSSARVDHSNESLERELRELSEGLRALREELGELRRELRTRNQRR